MFLKLFGNISSEDKNNAVERLIEHSSPDHGFFVMVALSISMATFALLLNSIIVLIGSMLIAPVIYPVLSTSLGITMADGKLIYRSFYTLLKSVAVSIVIACLIGIFFIDAKNFHEQTILTIINRDEIFISVAIAVIAGFAAAYSLVKPKLNEALPGVAISISLIPPLAAIGIGLSHLRWDITISALLLFSVNVVGIILASLVVFSLLNFSLKKRIAKEIVKKEDKILEKENGKT